MDHTVQVEGNILLEDEDDESSVSSEESQPAYSTSHFTSTQNNYDDEDEEIEVFDGSNRNGSNANKPIENVEPTAAGMNIFPLKNSLSHKYHQTIAWQQLFPLLLIHPTLNIQIRLKTNLEYAMRIETTQPGLTNIILLQLLFRQRQSYMPLTHLTKVRIIIRINMKTRMMSSQSSITTLTPLKPL